MRTATQNQTPLNSISKPGFLNKAIRFCLLALALLMLIGSLFYWLCPRPELKQYTSYSTALFDSSGKLLKLSLADDDRYRIYQQLDDIAPQFIEATLLYEDQDYFTHFGVDTLALLRAFWETYVMQSRRVGASTIVMQVARLRWQIPSHTLSGKLTQILRALQLSRHYSKQQILQAYFNLAPYGGNIEGIGAASLIYFNKLPRELNLPEALTLAVIPQNPNKRNPTAIKHSLNLRLARDNLFARWLEMHPEAIDQQKFLSLPLQVRSKTDLPAIAPHFTQFVVDNNSRWRNGVINTTLDRLKQQQLQQVVANYVASNSSHGIHNAAALLLNYRTMEIEAMVGSADFHNVAIQGQVNGTLAKRSPGSTLKPFVYGLAIDEGLIHPMSLLKDSPRRYGGFTPENFDKRFVGPIVAKNALIQSRNVPAVFLQAQLKQRSFYQFLQDAGVSDLRDESFYGLALALGGGELSMLELVHLYSLLANQGQLKAIHFMRDAPDTKTYVTNDSSRQNSPRQLLSAEASFLVLDMLKDNPPPDALSINTDYLQKNQVAWKTGTSWAFRDAWAVGVSGPYVLAVWVGNFDGRGNNTFIGRSAAGPLLFAGLDAILPNSGWQVDSLVQASQLNLKKIQVCANTGDLFEKYCPAAASTWFIPGVSPIKVSNVYRRIAINKSNGLRACQNEPGKTEAKVFEFWPSDFLYIFNQAGISLKTPPAYDAACSLDQKSSSGQSPIITSPQTSVEYVIQSDQPQNRQIPFAAVVDPDVEQVFWFVDGKFAGSANKNEPFVWQASNGEFLISAVDDSGRAASKPVRVLQVQ